MRNVTMVSDDSQREGKGGNITERLTVNLIARASRALARSMERDGDGKTDVVVRALPIYDYIAQVLHDGGSILVEETPGAEPKRLMIF